MNCLHLMSLLLKKKKKDASFFPECMGYLIMQSLYSRMNSKQNNFCLLFPGATLAGYLIISVAMAILCPACGRRFSESRGLGTHKRYCKDMQGLVTWAKHYNDSDDQAAPRSPKRARNHGQGLGHSIDPEDDMV